VQVGVLSSLGEGQIPSVLEILELVLVDYSKYTVGSTSVRMELKVQGDIVRRTIAEIVKTVCEMEKGLEKVVTWTEGKHGVQGSYGASSGGEVEKVTIPILGEASIRWSRKLGLEYVLVGVIPAIRSAHVDRFTKKPRQGVEQEAQEDEGFCLE